MSNQVNIPTSYEGRSIARHLGRCVLDYMKDEEHKKEFNEEFIKKLDKKHLIPITLDLTADNGDTTYGTCEDYVGIVSCDQYRKYRKYIPLFEEWMWTCTPWDSTPYSGTANYVRIVNINGRLRSKFNDISMSELFRICFEPICKYCVEYKEWLIFDETHWKRDTESMLIRQYMKKFILLLQMYCDNEIEDNDGDDETLTIINRYRAFVNKYAQTKYRDGRCLVKIFKNTFLPEYKNFGCMGDR